MRTKTGILWTILVIDFLLVLADPDTATTTPTTEVSTTTITTISYSPTTSPALTQVITSPSVVPSDPLPTLAESTVTLAEKPTTTEPLVAKSTITEPPTANPTTTEPPTANLTTTELLNATSVPAELSTIKPTTTEPTAEKTASATSTPTKSTATESTSANPGPADHTPANPTNATPAAHPSTQDPSSLVSTHQIPHSDQTPTSTTVVANPPSTQPSPDQTSQGPFVSSPEPELTTLLRTTKRVIVEPFSETITLENMEESTNKENSLAQSCQTLLKMLGGNGSCTLSGKKVNDQYTFTSASMAVDPAVIQKIYDEINRPPPDPTPVPHTLIAILSSCGALVLILVIFALYCTYHHRSYRKNQQHLTEELQTVENGYHDNPTLEVMEVQPEMQEKKVALNGEFNDSWIVPFDNLAKEEMPDEEDTHL